MGEELAYHEFAARVLSLYRPPLRAKASWRKMEHALRVFGLVGVEVVEQFDTAHVARFIASRAERNVNGLLSVLRCLRTAGSIAVAEGWLDRAPQWRRLMPRPGPRRSVRHYSREEVGALLDLLERERAGGGWEEGRLHALAALVAYTGLRKSEALNLKREDVDLAAGLVFVVARRRLKTLDSAGPVPMPPELGPILGGWLSESGSEWVFPGKRRAGPWLGGSPGYRPMDRLRQAGERAGVAGLTFHSLRHTLGKLMVGEFGLSVDQARTVLRHTDARTTELYVHRDDVLILRRIGDRITFRRKGDDESGALAIVGR